MWLVRAAGQFGGCAPSVTLDSLHGSFCHPPWSHVQRHELGDFPVLSPPPNILPLARGAVGACESLWPGIRLRLRTEDCWWPEVRIAGEWVGDGL